MPSMSSDWGPSSQGGRYTGWEHPQPSSYTLAQPPCTGVFLLGGGIPHLCDVCPWGARHGPRPRSEQLCPLRPQAAQPLGALLPWAAPRPPGPTGQVLALALGQVTYLLSPPAPWCLHLSPNIHPVSASTPQTNGEAQRGNSTSTSLLLLSVPPFLRGAALVPPKPVSPPPRSVPRALSSGSGVP